ncbi:hypothetical protein J26TS2_25710 [Shouchella clausii]|nr:hypothetical protein J26TS2_25710 [Shouchella clausii]
MARKALEAEQALAMLEEMASELTEQSNQFADFASFLFKQRMLSTSGFGSGDTATSIADFWRDGHGPFLKLLRRVLEDFAEKLETIRNDLANEFSEQAVIKEAYIMDELYEQLNELKIKARTHGQTLADIKSEYADIVSLPHFNYEPVEQGLTTCQQEAEDTVALLHEKDVVDSMNQIADDISMLSTYVDHLRTVITKGDVSIATFHPLDLQTDEQWRTIRNELDKRYYLDIVAFGNNWLNLGNTLFGAGQNVLAGASIAIGHYGTKNFQDYVKRIKAGKGGTPSTNKYVAMAKNGFRYALGSGKSAAATAAKHILSEEQMRKVSNHVTNAKTGFKNAVDKCKIAATKAAINIASNDHVRKFGEKFSNFKVDEKAKHIAKYVETPATRALGIAGAGFTVASNFNDELINPEDPSRPRNIQMTRFLVGTGVELGSASVGAFVGGAIGTAIPIPGMTFVGAAVGGIVGGYVGGKIAPVAKDLAESAVKGLSNAKEKVSEGLSNIGSGLKQGAGNLVAGVAGWFS